MAVPFFPSSEERGKEMERARFLERVPDRFGEGAATLKQLAAEFGRNFPGEAEGFPYDFALRVEQAGIPARFITDLEMQCVKDDLEMLVNSFRRSYVFGGIARDDYYSHTDTLRLLVRREFEGKEGHDSAELRKASEQFINAEPDKGDVDAFLDLYRGQYAAKAMDKRQLFREFNSAFEGNARSFDFFQYELAEVLEGKKLKPKDIAAAREETRLVERLQEKGAFYAIEWLSLMPEYVTDILIAMYPELAHDKDELRGIFSSTTPDNTDSRELRQFLGVCRKQKTDSISIYDGRISSVGALSTIATKIFEAKHGADEVVTTILTDVVINDYRKLFEQDSRAVVPELEKSIAEAPHAYVQLILTKAMEHYHRMANAKLLGVMPRIQVK